MKDSIILYTNDNTNQSIWAGSGRVYISDDSTHQSMALSHTCIREMGSTDRNDMAEAIKLLLKMHGQKI